MTTTTPTLRFLLRHPAHFIALGFGAGLAPVAPGTFGTLVAIPIAWALRTYAPDAVFVAAIVVLRWSASGRGVTGRDLGVPDHGAIVWDEVVAFLLVLYFVGDELPADRASRSCSSAFSTSSSRRRSGSSTRRSRTASA